MRLTVLSMALLMVAAPAMADIGSVQLSIHSPDDNGPNDLDPTVGVISYAAHPGVVPIWIDFSATASGPGGANTGVSGVALDVSGSAMAGVGQAGLTPDATFTGFAFSGGLGFDLLWGGAPGAGGTGGVGIIAGIGDVQALPGAWNSVLDADNVGHAGEVVVAAGNVAVGAMVPSVYYDITVTGNSSLWNVGKTATIPAEGTLPASIQIHIIPEPATLLLLAPALLALRRRRA